PCSAEIASEYEMAERQRRKSLVEGIDDDFTRELTAAADQFIVTRGSSRSMIAGYPWFADWGRDSMITLPGLTLATGRFADAADILRTFARYVRDGLLPNNFPDHLGAIPGYNTVDASLWYFIAVHAYQEASDDALVDDILP